MKRKKFIFISLLLIFASLLPNFLGEVKNTEASWQPNTFLTQEFWDSDWTSGNLISALFGDGTTGSSAYNRYWEDMDCNLETMKNRIYYVTSGNQLNDLTGNAIYILSGEFINITSEPKSCSAIVGMGDVSISSSSSNIFNISAKKNVIIDNIKIKGNGSNNAGIYLCNAHNNTINNVEIWRSDKGILLDNSNHNTLNKIKSHDNINFGIQLLGSNNNYVNNSQVYNNSDGILLIGEKGTATETGRNSNSNILNNILIFNNRSNGITLNAGGGGNGIIGTTTDGKKGGDAAYNIITNSQIFKNKNGVVGSYGTKGCGFAWSGLDSIGGNGGDLGYNIIYNNTIYNNTEIGIIMHQGYAQSLCPNGGQDGFFSGQIVKDSYIYNSDTAFLLYSNPTLPIKGEGSIYVFDNTLITGSIQYYQSYIGQTLSGTHTLHTNTENTSYHRLTNAVNSSGQKLLNGTNWTAMRGTGVFLASEPNKYIFGKKIPKQIQPVRYNSLGVLEPFGAEGLDRNPNEYIAAVNMEVSSADQDIINYYYGPNSEFTHNRNDNNCSLGAFTVEYINDQTGFKSKLISNQPLGHTIYVLPSGSNFSSTGTISINDNCTAIVSQKSGARISVFLPPYYGANHSLDSSIKVNGVENVILDNFSLDGNLISNHGIYLYQISNQDIANNNTIANIRSYNHKENGITLGVGASYNNIMNTQTWNNKKNGIEIFLGGKYNIINNSISYNNTGYGIRFGNDGNHNTINNSQFFNNGIGGIFADSTTEQNVLNNIHTYNNAVYGLNFKRSSGNKLNNIYSYNNKIGLNITDTSCINNKYNGDLQFFANSQTNLSGTNGSDSFLSGDNPDQTFPWYAGILEFAEIDMNCSWATNPRRSSSSWFLNQGSGCVSRGIQTSWSTNNPNLLPYLFGLGISKQIVPVGYSGSILMLLNNQYNPTSYVGEVNPIIWTDPGNITILSGNEQDLDLNIDYEMNVVYNVSDMINHDFDVFLTIDDEFSGHLQIYSDGAWHNIGSGQSGVDFQATTGIKIVVTTPNEYYKTMTGILYIGTQEYGYKTGSFSITTIPDPTPPTIVWSGNIDPNSLRSGQANTWQATITGVYETTANYSFVTGADDCNTGVAGIEYTGDLKNIVLESNYATLNDKYVCVIAKDNINGEYSTALSNQIKISKMEFVDDIATGPVNYDIIDIDFQNIQNYGYRRVNSGSQCNNSLSGLDLIAYETPIVVNDISLNGKYMCVYGEDGLGSGKYMPSANKLNIIDYSQFVHFIDDVSADWVLSDTISVYFTGTNFFVYKKYKRVENAIDCNNSGGMTDYTGAITITNEDLNGKHFCLYSKEINSGIENYLVSTNKLKIDRTKPDTPTIISPINEQSIYWLIVETTGANDTQSGLSGFDYEIALDATFLDNVSVGEVNSTGNVFSPVFNKNDRKYSIRTRAIDKVGNKSERSNIVTFNYKNLSNFEFINVVNAQLGTAYVSNEITMGGLGVDEVIEVKVSSGRLFRNGNLLGTTGLVKNDDKLTIKMISSSEYDETVETKLTIANRLVPRKITTMSSGFSLTGSLIDSGACAIISSGDYLNAESILNSIVSMYTNPTQLQAFLLVMKSMLQDNIALAGNTGVDNMKCLLYLVDQYLITHFGMGTDPNVHKTPSCKEYLIVHNTEDNTYYSPNTIKKTKFGSRDELVKFLDFNNPGDCHINTYGNTVSYDSSDPNRHIAPNGKVYRIESNNLGYSSPDFINIKHFATINELRAFIDKNNPAIVVWDHLVDATFEPIVHTAPNDKTYKIYKTNRGYMSYKLIKVQYFDTLESLKNYINKNNQK